MESQTGKTKSNKLKRRIIFITTVVLIAIVCAMLIFKFAANSKIIGSMINIPFNGDYSNVAILDDSICILDENNLKIYDGEGNDKKSVTLEISDGKLIGNYNKLIVSSKEYFSILDKNGTLVEKVDIPFEVQKVNLDDNLVYVLGDKLFQIYDLDGKLITESSFNSLIGTVSLSTEMDKFLVTTLEATNDNFKSDLYLNKFKDKKNISQTLKDEVIMYSKFIDNDKYITVSNKQILLFEDFKIINKIMINDFKDISFSESNIYILNGDTLNVYDFNLTLSSTVELESDFSNIYSNGNTAVLIGKNNYGIYKHKSDSLEKTEKIDDVQSYIINNNGLYLLHLDSVTKVE